MPELLLVEVGCEEIPARMLADLARQFAVQLGARLSEAALLGEPGEAAVVSADFTPRRLVARVEGVAAAQLDRQEREIGPPARIGIGADGGFTPQAIGFAAKFGATAADLSRVTTPKGDYVAVSRQIPGRPAREVLAEIIPKALLAIELPRSMRWESGTSLRFIRPVRWVLGLLGTEVIPFELGGLTSGRASRGHRTLGAAAFEAGSAADYPAAWRANHVIAPVEERRGQLNAAVARVLSEAGPGARVRADAELLETLVNLTEFPDAVAGRFDPVFLERLPEEVLVTVMRDHQKYFAVEDQAGRLAPRFVAIINNAAAPAAAATIRHGNERVLRARFNDAQFFFAADRRRSLGERLGQLESVTYHVALGTYREKATRMAALASWFAGQWQGAACDAAQAATAGELAKCDLTAEMVKEFPELQGIMGGIYARLEKRPETVALAIYDHYRPTVAGGELPRTPEGGAVAMADKLDSIVGMFAIGELPKGSGDPWALRRQANGVLRILLAADLPLSLTEAVEQALRGYATQSPKGFRPLDAVREDLRAFFRERLMHALREEGLAYDTINAVLAAGADPPLDVRRRARALEQARRKLPAEFAAIAAALKRMRNIVRKEGGQEQWQAHPMDAALVREPAEQGLRDAVRAATGNPADSYDQRLLAMGSLAGPLDRFFNEVRVNAEDPAVRANRLALLAWAIAQLGAIADFSEIVVASA